MRGLIYHKRYVNKPAVPMTGLEFTAAHRFAAKRSKETGNWTYLVQSCPTSALWAVLEATPEPHLGPYLIVWGSFGLTKLCVGGPMTAGPNGVPVPMDAHSPRARRVVEHLKPVGEGWKEVAWDAGIWTLRAGDEVVCLQVSFHGSAAEPHIAESVGVVQDVGQFGFVFAPGRMQRVLNQTEVHSAEVVPLSGMTVWAEITTLYHRRPEGAGKTLPGVEEAAAQPVPIL